MGEVVLIGEGKMPRQMCKMGRIEHVFLGGDGFIRACSMHLLEINK